MTTKTTKTTKTNTTKIAKTSTVKSTAKKVKKVSTRKAKPYSVKIDGKTFNCKTACADISSIDFPLMEGSLFLKKCKNCPVGTQEVCLGLKIQNTPAPVVKKSNRISKPYGCVFDCFLIGTKKEDAVKLVIESGLAEKTAKRFVNDVYFVSRTGLGIGRAIGKGGLIERYLNFVLYGIGEVEPTGCKGTIGFCKHLAAEIKLATI